MHFPHRLDRRSLLFGSLLTASLGFDAPARGGLTRPRFSAYPFQLGVASGEPDPQGVVLWTRLAPRPLEGGGMPSDPVVVEWQIAEDEAMTRVVQQGKALAVPERAHSVHVEVEGLRPDRWYWYQFRSGGEISPRGRTRTTPEHGAKAQSLRFAFASCQHYESGLFTAYEHMAREELDLVIHLGDYIYEGAGRPNALRTHVGRELDSLDDYRNRHAQYRTDAALQGMHALVPWLVTWDDHEVDNNYAAEISEQANVKPVDFLKRRARAYQAYYEHMPLRRASIPRGPDMRLYRRVRWGRHAEIYVLDTRQFRSDQPCGDGNKPPCPEALAAHRTMLGRSQREWLMRGLDRSPATWNILAQQVMMAPADRAAGEAVTMSMDQWPGYEFERRRLLQFLHERRVSNPVVLTGDIHTNWANELHANRDGDPGPLVAAEFVGTSISSGGDGVASSPASERLLSENPFVKFHNAQRGYVRCQVGPRSWRTDYQVVPYVTRPGAPLETRATFVLESGSPKLQRG